jgi:putative secreted protein
MKKIIILSSFLAFSWANAQTDSTATARQIQPIQQTEQTQRVQRTTQTTQVTTTPAPHEEAQPTTIEGVFQQLIDKSGTWQNFKMLDRARLATFQRSMSDSINSVRTKLVTEKQKVQTHETTIKELNDKITELESNLNNTQNQKDSVSFFGILVSKGVYNSIMWGIVIALGALLALYIYKYTNGNVVTKKSINDLADLQEEYENYRKAAIEREQKVRRQLQDEINKHR